MDRFSSTYLIGAAAKVVRDVAILRDRAATARKKLPTLTVQAEVRFASAKARHAFAEELSQQIADLAAKYHDEESAEGRTHRVILGAYPKITKTEDGKPLPPKEHS